RAAERRLFCVAAGGACAASSGGVADHRARSATTRNVARWSAHRRAAARCLRRTARAARRFLHVPGALLFSAGRPDAGRILRSVLAAIRVWLSRGPGLSPGLVFVRRLRLYAARRRGWRRPLSRRGMEHLAPL